MVFAKRSSFNALHLMRLPDSFSRLFHALQVVHNQHRLIETGNASIHPTSSPSHRPGFLSPLGPVLISILFTSEGGEATRLAPDPAGDT